MNLFTPTFMSIDQMGWSKFLNNWADQSTELVRERVFKYGLPGSTEGFVKEMENDFDIAVPHEIYFGGADYPPKNQDQERLVKDVLKQVELLIEKAFDFVKSKEGLNNC